MQGLEWDGAVDWFAAGCVVFEIATGRSLFPLTSSCLIRLAAIVNVLGTIPNCMGYRVSQMWPGSIIEQRFNTFKIRCPRRNVREAVEVEQVSRLQPLEVMLEKLERTARKRTLTHHT